MKTCFAACLFVFSTFLAGCSVSISPPLPGSGTAALEERETKDFSKLELEFPARVEITVGEEPSILIQADDNIVSLISTRVRRDKLTIKCLHNVQPVTEIVVTITVPNLESISIDGAGEVSAEGFNSEHLDLEIDGAGDLQIAGVVHNVKLEIDGVGDADLAELRAISVDISIDGAADATVHAVERLDVAISGAGDVRYKGDPHIHKRITGAGDVIKMGRD